MMTIRKSLFVSYLVLLGALGAVNVTAVAADSSEAALATETQQMDQLTVSHGEPAVVGKISPDFATFAGSDANARALVSGLRNGTPVTLTSSSSSGTTASTTFTPPTGKMGYGNVFITLALAKQQLTSLGITQPTAE